MAITTAADPSAVPLPQRITPVRRAFAKFNHPRLRQCLRQDPVWLCLKKPPSMLKSSCFSQKPIQFRALVIVNAHALLEYRVARNKIDMQAGSRGDWTQRAMRVPAPRHMLPPFRRDFIAFGTPPAWDKSGCRIAAPACVQHAFKFKTRESIRRLRQWEYALALPCAG